MLVVEGTVNLDLTCELLAGLSPGKIGLWHDLKGPGQRFVLFSLDRLDSTHLIALGKSSFTEEASFLVFDDLTGLVMIFWVDRLNFFFNDL